MQACQALYLASTPRLICCAYKRRRELSYDLARYKSAMSSGVYAHVRVDLRTGLVLCVCIRNRCGLISHMALSTAIMRCIEHLLSSQCPPVLCPYGYACPASSHWAMCDSSAIGCNMVFRFLPLKHDVRKFVFCCLCNTVRRVNTCRFAFLEMVEVRL